MSENITITVALNEEEKQLLRDIAKWLRFLANQPIMMPAPKFPGKLIMTPCVANNDDRDAVVKALRKAQDRYGNVAFDIGPDTRWGQVADNIDMVVNQANKWQALCRGIEDNVDLMAVMNSFDKEPL